MTWLNWKNCANCQGIVFPKDDVQTWLMTMLYGTTYVPITTRVMSGQTRARSSSSAGIAMASADVRPMSPANATAFFLNNIKADLNERGGIRCQTSGIVPKLKG